MPRSDRSARLWIEPLESRLTPAVTVRFDYSFDTSGMFNSPDRRAALDRVAATLTARMSDSLDAVVPGGTNTWNNQVYDAAAGTTRSISNPSIGENELLVYITGGSLGGALGLASGGAYSARGTQEWLDAIRTRGEAGVDGGTDFAPWGGMIAFNTGTNWDWTAAVPNANQYDFDSVALHELMHVFGVGLDNPSFNRQVSNGSYNGAAGTTVYGGAIPMQPGDDHPDHFAAGTRYAGQEAVMNPAIAPGVQKRMTELEYAVMQDVGWGSAATTPAPVAVPPVVPPPPIILPTTTASPINSPLPAGGLSRFVVGNGQGAAGTVTAYGSGGQSLYQGGGIDPTAASGNRVASGDVNGDGVSDYVLGSGPNSPAVVTVVNGKDGSLIHAFRPFEDAFRGGVYVAAGDVTGDGRADIAVGAGEGGGPRVKLFDGGGGHQFGDFWGIEDPNFGGGVRVALGDVNGDGRADLVAAAGEGGGPRVAVYNGTSVRNGVAPTRVFGDFMAFEPTLNNGTYVAVADLTADGLGDIVCGAGEGGSPRVTVFNTRSLMAGNTSDWLANYFAGNPNGGGGVKVASADVDADGRDDLITGPAAGTDGMVRVYSANAFGYGGEPLPMLTVTRPEWGVSGAYVG